MTEAIKTMKLYSQVERIHNDLASVGIGREDPLSLDVLTRFDQLHYHGTDAVDEAIRRLDLGPADSVLDIGAGFGGPARYLGATSGARVTAVELQPDLDATGADLTRRTGLDDRVTHICGDIHTVPLEPGSHTAAVSYLALYHIPDRPRVFRRLSAALAGGGRIYIEDLYLRQPLNDYEARMMREDLFGNTMAERDGYIAELTDAGFHDVAFEDESEDWGAFCRVRLDSFRASRDEREGTHGPEVVAALDAFYTTMVDLFDGGNMGGARIVARKAS